MSDESQNNKNPFKGFRIEIDPEKVEETLRELRDRVNQSVTNSRYTKVRLSYKGRTIAPDMPLTLFLAGEGVAFLVDEPIGGIAGKLGCKGLT